MNANQSRIEPQWQRAMTRAEARGARAIKITDHLYAVKSATQFPSQSMRVELNSQGRIFRCLDPQGDLCRGWRGRDTGVCYHAGAVARRLLRRFEGSQS